MFFYSPDVSSDLSVLMYQIVDIANNCTAHVMLIWLIEGLNSQISITCAVQLLILQSEYLPALNEYESKQLDIHCSLCSLAVVFEADM